MKTIGKIIVIFLASLVAYEFFIQLSRRTRKSSLLKRSEAKALETSKPLLIIGDKSQSLKKKEGIQYVDGDKYIQISECSYTKNIQDNLIDYLKTIDNDKFVVFADSVLEYVNDVSLVEDELKRISSGDLFILNTESYSLMTYMYPTELFSDSDMKHVINSAPPLTKDVVFVDKESEPIKEPA